MCLTNRQIGLYVYWLSFSTRTNSVSYVYLISVIRYCNHLFRRHYHLFHHHCLSRTSNTHVPFAPRLRPCCKISSSDNQRLRRHRLRVRIRVSAFEISGEHLKIGDGNDVCSASLLRVSVVGHVQAVKLERFRVLDLVLPFLRNDPRMHFLATS